MSSNLKSIETLLSLFPIDRGSKVGITSIPSDFSFFNDYPDSHFVEGFNSSENDHKLCGALNIDIWDEKSPLDIIISDARGYASQQILVLETMADEVLIQVDKSDLMLDINKEEDEPIRLLNGKSREIIQIGAKNDFRQDCLFFIRSSKPNPSEEVSLNLSYYECKEDFLEKKPVGQWQFKKFSKPQKERAKNRVDAYDINFLWSFFPADYLLFCKERLFNLILVDEKPSGDGIDFAAAKRNAKDYFYPVWVLDKNLDNITFFQNPRDLRRALRNVQKEGRESSVLLIVGKVAVIPNDRTETYGALIRALLTLLNSESTIIRQKYWLSFVRFDYSAANVLSRDEALYRLQEWFDNDREGRKEYQKKWEELKIDPYNIPASSFTEETDLRLYIDTWSKDGTKDSKNPSKKRECRRQPILNLMLYALGISREQYKYLQKKKKQT